MSYTFNSAAEYRKFVKDHEEIVSKICDIFTENQVFPEDGERILIHMLAISLAHRQESPLITSELLARIWQLTVAMGE